jgi:hypothetical protein
MSETIETILRIGRLGFGAGRQRMALERGTTLTLMKRPCSPQRGLQSHQRNCAGVAKRRRELIPTPKPLFIFYTQTPSSFTPKPLHLLHPNPFIFYTQTPSRPIRFPAAPLAPCGGAAHPRKRTHAAASQSPPAAGSMSPVSPHMAPYTAASATLPLAAAARPASRQLHFHKLRVPTAPDSSSCSAAWLSAARVESPPAASACERGERGGVNYETAVGGAKLPHALCGVSGRELGQWGRVLELGFGVEQR